MRKGGAGRGLWRRADGRALRVVGAHPAPRARHAIDNSRVRRRPSRRRPRRAARGVRGRQSSVRPRRAVRRAPARPDRRRRRARGRGGGVAGYVRRGRRVGRLRGRDGRRARERLWHDVRRRQHVLGAAVRAFLRRGADGEEPPRPPQRGTPLPERSPRRVLPAARARGALRVLRRVRILRAAAAAAGDRRKEAPLRRALRLGLCGKSGLEFRQNLDRMFRNTPTLYAALGISTSRPAASPRSAPRTVQCISNAPTFGSPPGKTVQSAPPWRSLHEVRSPPRSRHAAPRASLSYWRWRARGPRRRLRSWPRSGPTKLRASRSGRKQT